MPRKKQTATEAAMAVANTISGPPPELTLETLERVQNMMRQEQARMMDEGIMERAFYGDRRRLPVQVDVSARADVGALQIRSRFGFAEYNSCIDSRTMQEVLYTNRVEDWLHHEARRHAEQLLRPLERQIYEDLQEQVERMNRATYGPRSGVEERLRHWRDLVMGQIDHPRRKDMELVGIPPMTWFRHKKVKWGSWSAKVLETVEDVNSEGSAMQHCLAGSYMGRIARGEYVAYHLTPPQSGRWPKSGFTLGFHVRQREGKRCYDYDQLKGKKNDTHYCDHPELLGFVRHIDTLINEQVKELDPSTIETREVAIA